MSYNVFPPISTSRLVLLPSSLAVEKAILEGRNAIEQITGLSVPDSWPGEDWTDALPSLIGMYEEHPDWCGWNRNILHLKDNMLIGGVGCIFPPQDDNSVTIGYHIVPEYRRQGYGLEAIGAYVAWLRTQPRVKTIKAQCFENNLGSIRILQCIGMMRVGTCEDKEGKKTEWMLRNK